MPKPTPIFILTTEPIEQRGGMEAYLATLKYYAEQDGFAVRVFHRQNAAPAWLNRQLDNRIGRHIAASLLGLSIERSAAQDPAFESAIVLSNSIVGWHHSRTQPHARYHLYHGTYSSQAKANRGNMSRRGAWLQKHWYGHVLEKQSGKRAKVLANSLQTQAELAQDFGLESHVIHCPLDAEHFKPGDNIAAKLRLGFSTHRKSVIFVGLPTAHKGYPLILKLIEQSPELDWKLVLRDVPSASQLPDNVTVYTRLGRTDLPDYYRAADACIVPSVYESFGYVVAEALACGTPTLSTAGGAADLLLAEPEFLECRFTPDADASVVKSKLQAVLNNQVQLEQSIQDNIRPIIREKLHGPSWWAHVKQILTETR